MGISQGDGMTDNLRVAKKQAQQQWGMAKTSSAASAGQHQGSHM
jgi:hypothetical protein